MAVPIVHEGYIASSKPFSEDAARLPASSPSAPALLPPGPEYQPRTPGGWNKGRRMPPLPPSEEFNRLHAAALEAFAFIDDDNSSADKALELIQQAIALNPEVHAAHVLLSEIFSVKGEEENAIAALFAGAHAAPRDPENWKMVADKCLQRVSDDRATFLDKAIYCYNRILDVDKKANEPRFDRAACHRELGNYGKALKDLDTILKRMPNNSSVLRSVAEVCMLCDQTQKARVLYEEWIENDRLTGTTGSEAFGWDDLNVYVELFAHTGDYDGAIYRLKALSRWLLGREDETYWNRVENDDREWDANDMPRRRAVIDYQPGRHPLETYGDGLHLELRAKLGVYRLKQGREYWKEASDHFEWLDPTDEEHDAKVYHYSDLYLEVAAALINVKEHEQALRFLEPLKRIGGLPSSEAWLALAQSSYICGNKEQAMECFEAAKMLDPDCDEAWYQLSKLYNDLGNRNEAVRNAEEATRLRKLAVRVTDRRRYERKDQRLAREAAERQLKAAKKLPIYFPPSGPVPDLAASLTEWQIKITPHSKFQMNQDRPEPRKMKRKKASEEEEERKKQEEVVSLQSDVLHHRKAMREGDSSSVRKWMESAQCLVSEFRQNRIFYPYERHITFRGYDKEARAQTFRKKWMKDNSHPPQSQRGASNPYKDVGNEDIAIPSIESDVPDDYRGIHFAEWLDIFLELALNQAKYLTEHDAREKCYETITAAIDCTVWYHQPESMLQIYITYFTCALILRDGNTLFNVVGRWFMRQYQFCTDAYRLFSALNLFYEYPCDHGGKDTQMLHSPFRMGPSQKFMFRQIKAVDALLPPDYDGGVDGPVPAFMRDELGKLNREDQDDQARRAVGGFPGFNERNVKPDEMDVVLLTLYGHILYASGSYPNALSYFYRAYTLDAKNSMVLLSIALSYAHQMFKRQNENRHLYLLRGLAFFEEYVDTRLEWAEEKGEQAVSVVKQEIEFNRARIWHMLGMGDLALRGYGKVAEMGKQEMSKSLLIGVLPEDFSMEAAYAMQTLYAVSGDTEMAQHITERWLVV